MKAQLQGALGRWRRIDWARGSTALGLLALPVAALAQFPPPPPPSSNTVVIAVAARPPMGGTVSGGGAKTKGASATVTAAANGGYTFVDWTENGAVVSTGSSFTFTASSNRMLTANFMPNECVIAVAARPPEGGTVGGGGAKTNGALATVTASANGGYAFVDWTENGAVVSTASSYTFTAASNRMLAANFMPNECVITLASRPPEGGTVSGGGAKTKGASATVTASANGGYAFVDWTENGTVVSTASSYTFTAASNRMLTANFMPNEWTIALIPRPPAGGTVAGGGSVAKGSRVTATATTNVGFAFTNWTENGSVVSTSNSYSFAATSNRTLTANFVPLFLGALADGHFGVRTNQFGFNVFSPSGLPIVVEYCTNLANPIWVPLQTQTNGPFYFGDPRWTNHPGRYYRIRQQ